MTEKKSDLLTTKAFGKRLAERFAKSEKAVVRELAKGEAAKEVLNEISQEIVSAVAEGFKVQLRDLGTFQRKYRTARQYRNPLTGDVVDRPAVLIPGFSVAKAFKTALEAETAKYEAAEAKAAKAAAKAAPKAKKGKK